MLRILRLTALALVVASAAARLTAGVAHASEYNVDQVPTLIPRGDARTLNKAGVVTTLDLLVQARTAEQRRQLAVRTRLAVEKLYGWVQLADLMRVRGIGPDVARLLTAAGVRTLADLQRCDPAATDAAVHEVNKRSHLSTNPPTAASISYWVQQAQKLPVVLE